MPSLVTLATYEQSKTACFLKERFESEDIDCFFAIISTNEGEWEEVRVQVKEYDVERAVKVMLRIQQEHDMDIEDIEPANLQRRIIVPTDFSKGSEYACHYAIHLAQIMNAEIKLLHVYPDPISDLRIKESATYMDYLSSTIKETEKRAKSGIVDFTYKIKSYMNSQNISGVPIHSSLGMGNIIDHIKGVSKKYNPDVIVLGTTGRREDSRSVFIGLANSIISGLNVPVYAIPGACSPEDFNQVRILYATDFNERDHNSLERLLRIVEPFNKQVTCIHIDTEHNPAKIERMEELNTQLKLDYSEHDIRCQLIEDEDMYHGIKDFAFKNQVNLLSFTVQKRRIFEKLFKPNFFKKILQESNLPILLFPS
jgi:nucleotide-binding universal stress UspA family protein